MSRSRAAIAVSKGKVACPGPHHQLNSPPSLSPRESEAPFVSSPKILTPNLNLHAFAYSDLFDIYKTAWCLAVTCKQDNPHALTSTSFHLSAHHSHARLRPAAPFRPGQTTTSDRIQCTPWSAALLWHTSLPICRLVVNFSPLSSLPKGL